MLSNTHITEIKEIVNPQVLLSKYAPDANDCKFVQSSRETVEAILKGEDPRFLVIVGPCSIHDYVAAIEYAKQLVEIRKQNTNLFIVMRVYFEKPRTRKGWKGFIYDPDLDESYQINKGLELARKLLLELTKLRIPVGTEFLDTISPQYLADLVTWGAIGARTSESQIHRQLASGLSMPIGFKNLTSGDYEKAIDGIVSASSPHNFLGIDEQGKASHIVTKGNPFGHLILRGGNTPNYNEQSLQTISDSLQNEKIQTGIIVDCSHGNSQKEYVRQILAALYTRRVSLQKKYPIRGIMLESNLKKGNQPLTKKENLTHGVSITDACLDIETTQILLHNINKQETKECESVSQIRELIREQDKSIYGILNGSTYLNIQHVPSLYHFEEDAEVLEISKGLPNIECLFIAISTRLSYANRLAEIKFAENPFGFLHSDHINLLTNRSVEQEIITLFPNQLFLKIIDLSKRIQLRCLQKICSKFRTGYLFGQGTISCEAVNTLLGDKKSYPTYAALTDALQKNEIDAILVPTHNSIIGKIIAVDPHLISGNIDHTIELSVFSNRQTPHPFQAETLYVEPHIYEECKTYIKSNIRVKNIVPSLSTRASCLDTLQDKEHAITIASSRNKSNFLYTLAENILEHNVTTFSFLMQKTQHRLAFRTLSDCIDVHCC